MNLTHNTETVRELFRFSNVTSHDVYKLLSTLDISKAAGLDGIAPRLLKAGCSPLAEPLAHVMNLSLSTGSVPTAWKLSRISPLHKDGDYLAINNYRPISVLSACMKIFEKLIHKQLLDYLDRNNILSDNQSGFRPMHSTQTCLLRVTDYLLENMNSGFFTGAVFLDLKKAFDIVQFFWT